MIEIIDQRDPIVFEEHNVRRHYDDDSKWWCFSVVDVVSISIESPIHSRAQSYWSTLKVRLKKEGSQIVVDCRPIKMVGSDGKQRNTDAADLEPLFCLTQSIPSKKAEPIKLWLAKVGRECIQELNDPELSVNRARESWLRLGPRQ